MLTPDSREHRSEDPANRLLRDLVAIDSVHSSLVSRGTVEAAIAERIGTALRAADLDVQVTDATGCRGSGRRRMGRPSAPRAS